MGRRHLRGYRVLLDFEPDRLEVSAVVDPELERAEFVAGEAEELFGARPSVYRSLEDAISGTSDLSVVDIVTAAAAHHSIAVQAASAGLHALCEKPMAPTVAACRLMQVAAQQYGTVLSVAENYRRDPISRLAAALLATGAIGDIRTVLDLPQVVVVVHPLEVGNICVDKVGRFWSLVFTTQICKFIWQDLLKR